ncbi:MULTISPECIES: ParB/RepB/Spo0J family partition protein [unclassified Rathayibacter]|uniref:ParB/RepB/Spo0J family partition protein n=1 Tax=unclassified Rathayibacter TaxID=2609250 RepID=UPI00188CD2FF|nr:MULTISPECIES: ParB/RepB/Spo0J family partition protein [unclassified Rathayibacter]MBF4461102.1 ParB/RepB/Spo0J family partition protein [Rathayibacter sp. VKM Ac-2879]MBF4502513.1 ParB/RepB/Spo0J family partition protein [Rathayibacter sp. VKM Ac-2878]
MATKRTGLGRGIGALIPTGDEARSRPVDVFFPDQVGDAARSEELLEVPGARLARLPLTEIVPNAAQPRSVFDEDDLAELVHSIREFGVLQPVVVRPVTGRKGAKYELVMGERRFRASKAAGLTTIPAVVKDTADENMLRDALLENLHRAELNPLEEASAYQQLLSDFGITQEALATRLGRSRPQISNTLRLLRLPTELQTRVAAGVLSAGHARAVLSLDDEELMRRLADKIVNEDLSVRAAEAAAAQLKAPRATKRGELEEEGGHAGHLASIAEHLGDRLNTRVKVTLGARKGQVVIDFATIRDLNRILSELGEPNEVSLAP